MGDVSSFLAIVRSRIYGASPSVALKALTAVTKFLRCIGARDEVVRYASEQLEKAGREVAAYYDAKYLDEGYLRMRTLTAEEREALVRAAVELDSREVRYKRYDFESGKVLRLLAVDGELRGWVRTCLVGLAARTFLRPIEIRRLLVRNVEAGEDRLVIRLRTAKRGAATVKIVEDGRVVEAVRRRLIWLADRGYGGPYVPLFPGRSCPKKVSREEEAEFMSAMTAYRYAYEVYEHAGISHDYRPFYGFRRLGVIEMNERNIPPVMIKEYMGWRKLDMISYYYKRPRLRVADEVVKMLRGQR